jgi:hypothetical protein
MRIAAVLAIVGSLLAASPEKPTLRIISPANGAVVRPGQKLTLKITGRGAFSGVAVFAAAYHGGESQIGINGVVEPMGKPPWLVSLEIPLKTDPGLYSLVAFGTTVSGTEAESKEVNIDVEPVEIPRVTFSWPALVVAVDRCISLYRQESPDCGFGLFISVPTRMEPRSA